MPTYDYKCQECNQKYTEIHSFKFKSTGCPYCSSKEVTIIPSGFAAKTDQSFEKMLAIYEKQVVKDKERFNKDDKFAANITGADDLEHSKKLDKVLEEQHQKNQASIKKMQESNDKNIIKKKE